MSFKTTITNFIVLLKDILCEGYPEHNATLLAETV